MEIEDLKQLPPSDQRTFLLGRIAREATSMDIALRFVHAALRGESDLNAFFDSPDYFSVAARECREMLRANPQLTVYERSALEDSVDAALDCYRQRNRFIHDLLREGLMDGSWELAHLTRSRAAKTEAVKIDFDSMVDFILRIVATTWRLRAAGMYILSGEWAGVALGTVMAEWNGTATSSR